MKGLFIKHSFEFGKKLNSLNLLMSHNNLEVVYGYVPEKGGIIVSDYKDPNTVEFVYILEGELEYKDNGVNKVLKTGDCFYQNNLHKSFTMYALRETRIITFSNTGDFNEIDIDYSNMYRVIDEIEEKDNYTKGHCKRVGLYAQKLANSSRCKINSMRDLMMAANAHDVGKCKVPDEILLKPKCFNEKERKIIMEHSNYGYELLKDEFGLNERVAEIVLYHHERYDGSGYPKGLVGEEIPIESRIIAIVDTFDAMTTTRPYQIGKDPQDALDEMEKFINEFDKELFQVFKELIYSKDIDIKDILNSVY